MFKAPPAVRLFLFMMALVSMVSAWLTGLNTVHWFTYVLPAFLTFAAISGLCPGLMISKKIMAVIGVKE